MHDTAIMLVCSDAPLLGPKRKYNAIHKMEVYSVLLCCQRKTVAWQQATWTENLVYGS